PRPSAQIARTRRNAVFPNEPNAAVGRPGSARRSGSAPEPSQAGIPNEPGNRVQSTSASGPGGIQTAVPPTTPAKTVQRPIPLERVDRDSEAILFRRG